MNLNEKWIMIEAIGAKDTEIIFILLKSANIQIWLDDSHQHWDRYPLITYDGKDICRGRDFHTGYWDRYYKCSHEELLEALTERIKNMPDV